MKMSTHQDNTRGVQVTDLPGKIEEIRNDLDSVEIDIRYRGDSNCMQGIVLDNVVIPGIIKAVNCHDRLLDSLRNLLTNFVFTHSRVSHQAITRQQTLKG